MVGAQRSVATWGTPRFIPRKKGLKKRPPKRVAPFLTVLCTYQLNASCSSFLTRLARPSVCSRRNVTNVGAPRLSKEHRPFLPLHTLVCRGSVQDLQPEKKHHRCFLNVLLTFS